MMPGNPFVYSQLQKRRRRSNPSSPVFSSDKANGNSPASSPPTNQASSPTRNPDQNAADHTTPPARSLIPSFAETQRIDLKLEAPVKWSTRMSDDQVRFHDVPILQPSRPSTATPASTDSWLAPRGYPQPPPGEGTRNAGSDISPTESQPALSHSPRTTVEAFHKGKEGSRNVSSGSLPAERMQGDEAGAHKNASSRFGKARLNLLNPMSLLARRRTSQAHPKPEDLSLNNHMLTVPAMPDNFDPRIRGTKVHDFSIPRPRRVQSHQDASSAESSPNTEPRSSFQNGRRASDLSGLVESHGERTPNSAKHSPLFKEHFNDDRQALQPGNKGYLHSLAASSKLRDDPASAKLPAFAKKLPVTIPDVPQPPTRRPSSPLPAQERLDDEPLHSPPRPPRTRSGDMPSAPVALPSVTKPSPRQSRKSSAMRSLPALQTGAHEQDLGKEVFPRHMKSTSSRFSFQLGGVDSAAQEKFLEDKHKQQEALKQTSDGAGEGTDAPEDEYADYDDDGEEDLEERIPGINTDANDELEAVPGAAATEDLANPPADKLNSFHFTPHSALLSPTTTSTTSQITPRDEEGRVIGFAKFSESPTSNAHTHLVQFQPKEFGNPTFMSGLGITSIQGPMTPLKIQETSLAQEARHSFDDDMYFDDGDFDHLQEPDKAGDFDEAIFDDEAGQIRDIPAQNAQKLAHAQRQISSGPPRHDRTGAVFPTSQEQEGSSSNLPLPDDDLSTLPRNGMIAAEGSAQRGDGVQDGLTEGNLAAYHNALVLAANEAEARGRFSRNECFDQASEDRRSSSQRRDSQPGLVSDESRFDLDHTGLEDDDDFPGDGDLEDVMIAEANAEVLENDDEGFYGQEFGFFARAHGKGKGEMVNGGYFGPRGPEGIKRSHSAKANFQEPSLTPITERSEWSARNSVASLHFPIGMPLSAQSIPSPGIAQLLDLESSSFDDEEISLSALMRLRRGAWGGSSSSINSLGGTSQTPNNSSPLAHLMSPRDLGSSTTGSMPYISSGPTMSSSIHSLATDSVGIPTLLQEEEEEDLERTFDPSHYEEDDDNTSDIMTTAETTYNEDDDDDDDDDGALTLIQNTPRKKLDDDPISASSDSSHANQPPPPATISRGDSDGSNSVAVRSTSAPGSAVSQEHPSPSSTFSSFNSRSNSRGRAAGGGGGSNSSRYSHAAHSHHARSGSNGHSRSGQTHGHAHSHSRTSSGGESISYVRDPEGSGGWVLERRRTGDDGELEVVGREYLAGARI